ncbi:uncharacterized protein [Eurosta solidaginis]|uniref:uncharacterized protein n=1 Tax=Eurosta solidaginis TaxID=178769 RepID=UPI00353172FE
MEPNKGLDTKPAFSSIHSDQGTMSDEMNQILEFSEFNSEMENGQETSQQNSDGDLPFTALVTDDEQKHDIAIEVDADSSVQDKSNGKPNWTGEPTRMLLDLVKQTHPKLGKQGALRSKTKMFIYLANEMQKHGYTFSAVQVENKFRLFERQYRKDKLRGKNSRYQKDLDEIFNPSLKYREKYDDSGSDVISDMDETIEGNIVDPRTARKQREIQRELQKTLLRIADDRQQYHNKVLYYLKKKDEREKRRDERAQKKLQLLELFVKQLYDR